MMSVLLAASCASYDMAPGSGGMEVGTTVLVYMAADNNLAPYAIRNIEAMTSGPVPDYFDEGYGDVLLVYADIDGDTPKLMRISKDSYGVAGVEVLREYEDHDSCSDSVMRAVLTYAAGLFPSQENGLVLWSHGTGWLPEGYYSNPVYSGSGAQAAPAQTVDPYAEYVKSFGAENGREMDIKTLAEALPVRYSFILMDACLMGGIEVAYELKDKCDWLIASSAEVLANGFPYDRIVGELFGGKSGLENICRLYYENYASDGATVALIDTRRLNELAESCLDIFLSGGRVAIQSLDMDSVQGYFRMGRHWFYDLDDFISRISPSDTAGMNGAGTRYDVFRKALDRVVVCKYSTEDFVLGGIPQFSIKKFSGLSTYIPNPENPVLDEYYKTLAWNKAVMMVE